MPTATHAYLRVTGQSQGVFKGGTSRTNRGDHWMELLAFELDEAPPRDHYSGPTSGKRTHGTITVTKAWGDDAALFFKALASNESLPQVVIEFTNQHSNGAEFIQSIAVLSDAGITTVNKKPPVRSSRGAAGEILKVRFTFARIEISHNNNGKWGDDSWYA